MSLGIKANMIVTRADEALTDDMKEKIALFCDVRKNAIIESRNVDNIYELPLKFQEQGLDSYILHKFGYEDVKVADMTEWSAMIERAKNLKHTVNIGLVGKYVSASDTYLSVSEALMHAGLTHFTKVNVTSINSEDLTEENANRVLGQLDGIIAPSGFGERGTTGKMIASRFAREHQIPYFGIGMGMQTAIIEFARNVLNLEGANSTEFDSETNNPVIILHKHANSDVLGGTLRLGNATCILKEGSIVKELYKQDSVKERHRHRYEFNKDYLSQFEDHDFIISSRSEEDDVVEIVELKGHPFFIGTQFQPEFKSRPNRSHPLFDGFIDAALNFSKDKVE